MKHLAILIFLLVIAPLCRAQTPNWQNLDPDHDGLLGISTEKAYLELLAGKKPQRVIVAVIDGGVDVNHEDLKPVIWNNPKEIAGNNKDDDRNGYADDVHGWNFIGGPHGSVNYDNLEITRLVRSQKAYYDSLSMTIVPESQRLGYQNYRKMKKDYDALLAHDNGILTNVNHVVAVLNSLKEMTGKISPKLVDFEALEGLDEEKEKLRNQLLNDLRRSDNFNALQEGFIRIQKHYKETVNYGLNLSYDSRNLVGDNYNNVSERYYGNTDVCGPDAEHGTHVAGIIGAARNNGIGIQGIADDVVIMAVRTIPIGDERDKDVANAIRYAADNGAKVINMSFGKPYSPNKKVVDDAVKYALSKDVLFIHAAGNDGKNLDDTLNHFFPSRQYLNKNYADRWIEVGASASKDDSALVAPFSNYGKASVDVFAPGVHIYSTTPGSKYEYLDGTSMAAPVVSGLAALLREYYPKLTAIQVKEIIMKTVLKRDMLKDKCVSGGVVNAYNALKLAATF